MVRPFSLGLATLRRDDRRATSCSRCSAASWYRAFRRRARSAGVVSILSFVMIVGVSALELLVCAIQAYVFALLTALYLNDAVHLH